MPTRQLDLDAWPRRDHFRLFQALDHPYFTVSVELDVTSWLAETRAAGRPFFASLVHKFTAIANDLEPFRVRVRDERVVVHDHLDPSFTVPWRGDLFNFCTVPWESNLDKFLAHCLPAIEAARNADHLLLDPAVPDDKLYLSCLPWYAFTSMTHAVGKGDTIPRLAWSRTVEREGRTFLPLNFQLHHGLLDGLHVAWFLERFALQ